MNWFTDRSATSDAGVRPWLPHHLVLADDDADVPVLVPPLAFDEADVARMAASLVDRSAREERSAAMLSPAARQADALESAAAAFAHAARERAEADRDAMERIVALASALAKALGPIAGDPDGLAELARELLVGLDAPAARLVAPAAALEALRPLLPELAAGAGFDGSLELEADDHLPEGAMKLRWAGGWSERDPDEIGRAVAALLSPLEMCSLQEGKDR